MKYLVALLILLSLVSYESVLFLVYAGKNYFWIKLFIYLFLLLCCLSNVGQLKSKTPRLIYGYGALMIYMIVPSVLAGAQSGYPLITTAIRVSHIFIFYILLLRYGERPIQQMLKWIGVALAIQSIVLYALLISGNQLDPIFVERYAPDRFGGTDYFTSYGLLGFGNWILESQETGAITFRAQSFFSEATKFAMFQMLPLFVCLAETRRSVLNFVLAALVGGSIIITFSYSAFVGLFFAAGFYWGMPRFGGRGQLTKFLFILAIVVSGAYAYYLFSRAVFETQGREAASASLNAIGRPVGSADIRVEWSMAAFGQLAQKPFGTGFTLEDDSLGGMGALPMAPVQWFLSGGLVGGLGMLALQCLLVFRHLQPVLTASTKEQRAMAACCIALMVTSIVHGNWADLIYFLPITILFVLESQQSHTASARLSTMLGRMRHVK